MSKYKYYFKKPRSEIAKDVFKTLLISGLFVIAASSPYFASNIIRGIKKMKKYPKKKVYNVFYYLKNNGDINFENRNGQLYISLTEQGKKKAKWMQIDEIKINKTKRWDGKWRIVMFDIAQLKRIYREAFRGKLKDLGFVIFQKSVWIIPYDCKDEIGLLKDFFGLNDKEIKTIITSDIGDSRELRKIFNL